MLYILWWLLLIVIGIILLKYMIVDKPFISNKAVYLWAVFFLVLWWIFAIYSVSIFESFSLTLKFWKPSNYFYFIRQLEHLWIAVLSIIVLYFVPLEKIKKNAWKIFLIVFLIQLLVFTPIWTSFHWAKWWLYIPWFGTLQPSEFFKLWFIIFFSDWLIRKRKQLNNLELFFAIIVLSAFCFSIFLLIPDLGTLLVLWPVVLILYYYVGWNIKHILIAITIWLTLLTTIWLQFDYIKRRIDYFFDPQIDKTHQWIWWQTKQALIAIWWWRFFGRWYGKWLQKFGFIPEAQSDFIFAALSEEIWFLWNSIMLMLYLLIIYIWFARIKYVSDPYLKNLAVGILSLIFVQAFVNIGVNTKVLPLTWLTLPFISYGWTSLIVNLWEATILYKILFQKAVFIPKQTKKKFFLKTLLLRKN